MSLQNKMNSEQKSVMESYMQQHPLTAKYTNRSRQERTRQNFLWDKLVLKLNELGPPERKKSEWRKTWTCLKYKTKMKKTAKEDDDGKASEISTDCQEEDQEWPKKEPEAQYNVIDDPEVPDGRPDTTHMSTNQRERMKKYFDCFSESVLSLPEHLQLKCRNEIFTVIAKYEEMAREQ